MAVFWKFKGPNIKYSHRDPQKARILRKYLSRGVGCSFEEPKKKQTKN